MRYVRQWSAVSILALFGLTVIASDRCMAQNVTVGQRVPESARIPVERIDHSPWSNLLGIYVNSRGMVNYANWKSSDADQNALDKYLEHISSASFPKNSPRETVLAFWINAYNAVTVKGILREYPTTSIRNHTPRLFGYNICKNLLLPVNGRVYSLEQIEHEVLRKMNEPRIHFAIVCASIGCPELRPEAYVADRLDQQLTMNTREFFADQTKFRYDPQTKVLAVSPILKWFADDFGATTQEQLRAIAPFLPDKVAQNAAGGGNVSVTYLDYNWSLNDQSR